MARTTLFHLRLNDDSDVALARQRSREVARNVGLPASDVEALTTAVSEIARNVVIHAVQGELLLEVTDGDERSAIVVTARDRGPGIAHLERAMEDGYTTGGGLGFGLPGARRLVDELELESEPGVGTTVTLKKWLHDATPARR